MKTKKKRKMKHKNKKNKIAVRQFLDFIFKTDFEYKAKKGKGSYNRKKEKAVCD